jgi:hypothetical protein
MVTSRKRKALNRSSPLAYRNKLGDILWQLENRWVGGDVYYVYSDQTTKSETGADWDHAFNTLDEAVNACTANHGDVIIVHQDHAENLAADSAVDIDKAGITVIGIRLGRQMPTFTATAAAGDFKIAANNVTIMNLRFVGGIDATTGILEITGTDWAVIDCEYRDSTGQATDTVMIVDGADRGLLSGYRHIGAAAAGANSAIAVDGSDDTVIENFEIVGNFAVGAIDFRTNASARVHICNGYIWNQNAADIGIVDTVTGSTGAIGPDIEIMVTDDAANITEAVTGATFHVFDPIYVCNAASEKGILINWTASVDEA